MDTTIVTIYCLCDDFLKEFGYRDDPQVRLSSAEVMTVALVAATLFSGNIEKARLFLAEYGYMPTMISKGRFNRRLHALDSTLWNTLFGILANSFKERSAAESDEQKMYAVDSLPMVACDNIRIKHCRLYPVAEHGAKLFRGYIPSKRRYFYGLRVHLVVTKAGEPVEFALAPASEADLAVFKQMDLELGEGSIICADKAYTDYAHEEFLQEVGLQLKAQRKKNSKRPMAAFEEFLCKPVRQYVETVFSGLSALFSRKIHAVTPRGFELKIVCSLWPSLFNVYRGQLGLTKERIMRRLAYLISCSLVAMLVAMPYVGAQDYGYNETQLYSGTGQYADDDQYAGSDQYADEDQYADDVVETLPDTGGVPVLALAAFALAVGVLGFATLRRIL